MQIPLLELHQRSHRLLPRSGFGEARRSRAKTGEGGRQRGQVQEYRTDVKSCLREDRPRPNAPANQRTLCANEPHRVPHGHGHTPLGDRPIDLLDIGDDLAVVLDELEYDSVDVMGYSFGGGAALRLAIQHPEVVRRLVIVSAGYAREGFFPELIPMQEAVSSAMADQMKGTPMYESYVAIAPNPDEFPDLLDAMGALMRKPYDWTEEVKTLEMSVMLVYGDSDMLQLDHIVKFYQLLGGGLKDAGWQREHMSQNRLAILPDLTHYEAFFAPELAATVLPFLNGESRVKTWADQVGE